MNANTLARQYDTMTPAERYCLMQAADGRGDEVEQERLIRASKRIALTMPDYAPHAHALEELTFLILIELLDDAARYVEMYDRADDDFDDIESARVAPSPKEKAATDTKTQNITAAEAHWQRALETAHGCGYIFRAKLEGWKLFCKQWQISPFLMWEDLPGFERLQRAIALSDHAAFDADGMLDWLNRRRKGNTRLLEKMPLTPSHYAAELQQTYETRITHWGGR